MKNRIHFIAPSGITMFIINRNGTLDFSNKIDEATQFQDDEIEAVKKALFMLELFVEQF